MEKSILRILDLFEIERTEVSLEGEVIQIVGCNREGFDARVIQLEIKRAIEQMFPDHIAVVEVRQLEIKTKESLHERQPKVQRNERLVIRGRFRDSI